MAVHLVIGSFNCDQHNSNPGEDKMNICYSHDKIKQFKCDQ